MQNLISFLGIFFFIFLAWTLSEDRKLTLRSAALVGGIREVAGALRSRGIYP